MANGSLNAVEARWLSLKDSICSDSNLLDIDALLDGIVLVHDECCQSALSNDKAVQNFKEYGARNHSREILFASFFVFSSILRLPSETISIESSRL